MSDDPHGVLPPFDPEENEKLKLYVLQALCRTNEKIKDYLAFIALMMLPVGLLAAYTLAEITKELLK